jgi:hypothetical protein
MSQPKAKTMLVTLDRERVYDMLAGGELLLHYGKGERLRLRVDSLRPWEPLVRIAIPEHMHEGMGFTEHGPMDELWSNGEYEVMVWKNPNGTKHLSIKRMDRAPVRNWRHMQQIKNEVAGPFAEAVELYPSEARVMDNANQYHLWVAPEGVEWPLGISGGFVLRRPEEVEAFNNAPGRGRQEPMQPGLTIGEALDRGRTPEQDQSLRKILGME